MANETTVVKGIEYKLYTNNQGPAVMVTDLDSGEVVSVSNFATEAIAGNIFDAVIAALKKTH